MLDEKDIAETATHEDAANTPSLRKADGGINSDYVSMVEEAVAGRDAGGAGSAGAYHQRGGVD